MKKTPFADIRGLLARALSPGIPSASFGKLPPALVEIYYIHSWLIDKIDIVRQNTSGIPESPELGGVRQRLEENRKILLDGISRLTGRRILEHSVSEGETLWSIAKKYNSEVYEITELNNIGNIFLPEKEILLIPSKATGPNDQN